MDAVEELDHMHIGSCTKGAKCTNCSERNESVSGAYLWNGTNGTDDKNSTNDFEKDSGTDRAEVENVVRNQEGAEAIKCMD